MSWNREFGEIFLLGGLGMVVMSGYEIIHTPSYLDVDDMISAREQEGHSM